MGLRVLDTENSLRPGYCSKDSILGFGSFTYILMGTLDLPLHGESWDILLFLTCPNRLNLLFWAEIPDGAAHQANLDGSNKTEIIDYLYQPGEYLLQQRQYVYVKAAS